MHSSKAELDRLKTLHEWVRNGLITELIAQVRIPIMPALTTRYTLERNSVSVNRKFIKEHKRRERVYTADFSYYVPELDAVVIEEFKSSYTRTRRGEAYKLRRHLLEMMIKEHNEQGFSRLAELAPHTKILFVENEFVGLPYAAIVGTFTARFEAK